MKETPIEITNNGWIYYDKCNCNGILKYKYRHPEKYGYELQWMVTKKLFKVLEKGKTKVPVTSIDKLNEILQTI